MNLLDTQRIRFLSAGPLLFYGIQGGRVYLLPCRCCSPGRTLSRYTTALKMIDKVGYYIIIYLSGSRTSRRRRRIAEKKKELRKKRKKETRKTRSEQKEFSHQIRNILQKYKRACKKASCTEYGVCITNQKEWMRVP